jgi:hypothetical protein
MLITNFSATGCDLYVLFLHGENVAAWRSIDDVPQEHLALAQVARRVQVTSEQYGKLCNTLVKETN